MPRYGDRKTDRKAAPRLAEEVIAELRRDYSDAQIAALLAMDGQRLSIEDIPSRDQEQRPAVQRGCICPPNHEGKRHEPDRDGFIVTSPSCVEHGCRSTYIAHGSTIGGQQYRTMGAVHGRHSDSG